MTPVLPHLVIVVPVRILRLCGRRRQERGTFRSHEEGLTLAFRTFRPERARNRTVRVRDLQFRSQDPDLLDHLADLVP